MKGTFDIAHYMNDPNHRVVIRVEDESSGVLFFELTTNKSDLMEAIMGLSSIDCEYELRGLQYIGKIRQHKSVVVPLDVSYWDLRGKSEDELRAYLKPFEVDGWMGNTYDMKNTNNGVRNKDGTYAIRVSFVRYVEKEGGNEDPR